MKKPFILFIIYLFFSLPGTFAQKIKTVKGTAQVRMEANMTENDTRKIAEELAKINALQMAFGSTADQEFNMMMRDGKADYNVIAKTEVKGEWIETSDRNFSENFTTEKMPDGTRKVKWITCDIKGKARKLPARALIDFYPLNCPELSCRTTEFTDGADLYLYFKSPVNGYLSVFLDDGNEISRLLPDSQTSNKNMSGVPVKSDKEYLFFSSNHNSLAQKEVDEYNMTMLTSKNIEFNYLYIVFSEHQFVKPILTSRNIHRADGDVYSFPKTLSSDDFQKWITKNKYTDKTFQVKKMSIMIKAK